MKPLIILFVLFLSSISFAQNLPRDLTCQDLIDTADGKLSRSTDGGRTYIGINRPQPKNAFSRSLLSYATNQCRRLSRREITVGEFNTLYDEKVLQLRLERERVLVEREKVFMERKKLENQQRALYNQGTAIRTQREAVKAQREETRERSRQAGISRQQQEAHHNDRMEQRRIEQQQLEQIRQELARPKRFTCTGGGYGTIHCF